MSHFTCLVVGDVEENLAKYNEQDEKYFTAHEEKSENYEENYEKHKSDLEFLEKYPAGSFDSFMKWWCGYSVVRTDEEEAEVINNKHAYARVDENNKVLKSVYFSNPDARWDWYVTADDGGRWSDYIKLNTGEYVNSALVRDVDFKGMYKDIYDERGEEYDKMIKKLGHIPSIEYTWSSLVAKFTNGNTELTRDEAIDIYNSQYDVKLFNEKLDAIDRFYDKVDNYCCSREEYQSRATFPFHSIVVDSIWYEKSEMGWWGCESNAKEPKEWCKQQCELFDMIADKYPDEEITLVDCHI